MITVAEKACADTVKGGIGLSVAQMASLKITLRVSAIPHQL
jgi:hypothetical protein